MINLCCSCNGKEYAMFEKRYIISDASKKVAVEPHVLRYWEEELELSIPRNEMGHRYYREEDIALLQSIKKLKEKGFQLRAIKMVLPDLQQVEAMDSQSIYELKEELNEKVMLLEGTSTGKGTTYLMAHTPTKQNAVSTQEESNSKADTMEQFRMIMKSLIIESMQETSEELSQNVSHQVSDRLIKELDYQIRTKEEADEERFRQLEAVITGQAATISEAAAAAAPKKHLGLRKREKKKTKAEKKAERLHPLLETADKQ